MVIVVRLAPLPLRSRREARLAEFKRLFSTDVHLIEVVSVDELISVVATSERYEPLADNDGGTTWRLAELKQRWTNGFANTRQGTGPAMSEKTFNDITDDVDTLLNDPDLAPAIAEQRSAMADADRRYAIAPHAPVRGDEAEATEP